jgi:outer membrane protein OmpA-like peptidoglycan-associated protein
MKMKKIYIAISVLLVSLGNLSAQTDPRSIEADSIRMIRTSDSVTVSFTLRTGKRATRPNYDLVINPVIKNGDNKEQLPPIVVQGRRSKVIGARHELAGGQRHHEQKPVYVHPGESLNYTATLPYENRMRGSELVFEGVNIGCCSSAVVELGTVADNILHAEPQIETKMIQTTVSVPRTTGERLSRQQSFIAPASEFELIEQTPGDNRAALERIITENRHGSISVLFEKGISVIDRGFADNNQKLVELVSSVRTLLDAGDTAIAAIVIAGFSSPEGSSEINDRLAEYRAIAVKEFLTKNSRVDPKVIRIFNAGADWDGLRELVEGSEHGWKQRALDIIAGRSTGEDPLPNEDRLSGLKGLDGGEPYRYMLANFFPVLRQASYIKVYYENR